MNPLTTSSLPAGASSRFFRMCAEVLRPSLKRHQSSYRRARSRLNVKPDASFLPSATEAHDHIIFNPPPSAPNVYHTPTIFLPKSDPRRQLYARSHPKASSSGTPSNPPPIDDLPQPVRAPYEKRYHLTEKDMAEMRELRKGDPVKWSRIALAKKFDCSNYFVGFVIEGLSKSQQEQQKQVTEVVKSRWGKQRRVAREDRALRREKWFKDE